jgi:hypothetical protein
MVLIIDVLDKQLANPLDENNKPLYDYPRQQAQGKTVPENSSPAQSGEETLNLIFAQIQGTLTI